MSEYGAIAGPGCVRFERVLPLPIERVWAYLTESEKRGQWLATGEMELRVGGRVNLRFHHADLSPHVEPTPERYKAIENGCDLRGEVTRCEPPRVLSFTWGDGSEVTFELTAREKDVLLVLTHSHLADRGAMVDVSGGWHTHLTFLQDRLEGHEPRPFWATHMALEGRYDALFPADAPGAHCPEAVPDGRAR